MDGRANTVQFSGTDLAPAARSKPFQHSKKLGRCRASAVEFIDQPCQAAAVEATPPALGVQMTAADEKWPATFLAHGKSEGITDRDAAA